MGYLRIEIDRTVGRKDLDFWDGRREIRFGWCYKIQEVEGEWELYVSLDSGISRSGRRHLETFDDCVILADKVMKERFYEKGLWDR